MYKKADKDLVYCNDVSGLILHVINLRRLDPSTALVRIGYDGGGNSSKILCNVFDPETIEQQNTGEKDTGVNKAFILALVENIPERHFNLKQMFERLHLHECAFVNATDMKCINLVLGLSVSVKIKKFKC